MIDFWRFSCFKHLFFLGLKLDFQVLKLFFKKSVKKYLQRQQYDFSKNDEKTWKFSKFWFFWNVLDHFTKIRKEKDFLKMKNKVLDELCGRQQCKFKIIDHQMIILPLKMLILVNKVWSNFLTPDLLFSIILALLLAVRGPNFHFEIPLLSWIEGIWIYVFMPIFGGGCFFFSI